MFNTRLWKYLLPFMGTLSFADDRAGGSGGNGDDDKGDKGDKGDGDRVAKSELDAANTKLEKMEQDLEDMRMEVMTPEYLEFLQAKEGGDKKDDKKEEPTDLADDKIEKMSKKELMEYMRKERRDEIAAVKEAALKDYRNDNKVKVEGEIREFASSHEDYETFRPIMYGLSLDPKNKSASLDKLYNLAKAHVKSIHSEPSEEEKIKQRKLGGEKPGGGSTGFEPDEILSDADATKSAVDEVQKDLGPLPSA